MKLDMDCVRDILLAVEDASFDELMTLDWLSEKLPDWSMEELHYACLKLGEGGLLDLMTIEPHMSYLPGIKVIISMTYKGHEYLANVRSNTVWSKTKAVFGQIGVKSVEAAVQIASNVISEIIKAEFNLR